MLFKDLTQPSALVPLRTEDNSALPPIASVKDRFLGLFFDFLLMSPLVSLCLAAMVHKTKIFFLLDGHSEEAYFLGTLVFLLGAVVIVTLQSLFLYRWQSTPGQFFLQLRVVSFPEFKTRLSFSQCLLRALLFNFSFLFFALPFLEILGHPLRRAFHERASDTLVITLKRQFDDGPHRLESDFISAWMKMSYFVMAFYTVFTLVSFYLDIPKVRLPLKGGIKNYCKEIPDKKLQGAERLDAALTLFVMSEISTQCLSQEAELALWSDPIGGQDLAYLAKYLADSGWPLERDSGDFSKEDKQAYFKKICREANSSACLVGSYLIKDNDSDLLKKADKNLLISQVLLLEEKYQAKDFSGSLEVIKKMQRTPVMTLALEKKYIRSIWALQNYKGNSKNRIPASIGNGWIQEFKEKYGIE